VIGTRDWFIGACISGRSSSQEGKEEGKEGGVEVTDGFGGGKTGEGCEDDVLRSVGEGVAVEEGREGGAGGGRG
jgi:hypothetical protein